MFALLYTARILLPPCSLVTIPASLLSGPHDLERRCCSESQVVSARTQSSVSLEGLPAVHHSGASALVPCPIANTAAWSYSS